MANNISGRNDENRASWRPQDEDRDAERHGQGQSGYGTGRYQEDRSFGRGNRNQSYGGPAQGTPNNQDDRWGGRGGPLADEDRGYNPDRFASHGYSGGPGAGEQGGGRHDHPEHAGHGRPQHRGYDQAFAARAGFDRGGYDQHNAPQGIPNRGGIPQGDRGQWNSYSRDEDLPSHGSDQTMYGQGARAPMQPGHGAQSRGGYGGGQQGGSHGGAQQGMPQGGLHRGKGPKGYQRSDDRIRESVCEALEHDDHIDATHIEVVVKNGEVMLTGTVDDRQTKRLAEDAITHLAGVKDVQNNLRVNQDRLGRSSSNNNGNGAHGHNETDAVAMTGGSDKKARS